MLAAPPHTAAICPPDMLGKILKPLNTKLVLFRNCICATRADGKHGWK